MPLPQQVVEQLGREPDHARPVAGGAMLFACGMLFLVAALYFGMKFGYERIVNAKINSLQGQVATADQSVTADQETELVDFYSQITNLKTILANHVYDSSFLTWLEKNTQDNVYYQDLELASGNQVTLKGIAKSEADVNQQVAIFEGSPKVANAVVTLVGGASQVIGAGTASGVVFNVTLTMQPTVFHSATQ